MAGIDRSWFAIDGSLDPLDHDGPPFFRFPLALAERVVGGYSAPGDWVLDPFCGFGTTLVAAQRLGRQAVGIEKDAGRAGLGGGAPFSLLFTSPPYTTFRDWNEEGFAAYSDDLRAIFAALAPSLRVGARVVVEMSSVRTERGVRTVAWDAAKVLAGVFRFEGEVVRCHTGPEPAGPGYQHSYLLLFTNA